MVRPIPYSFLNDNVKVIFLSFTNLFYKKPCTFPLVALNTGSNTEKVSPPMLNIILTVHLIIALGLISIVLIQRSEGGGLGIGGGGSGSGMTGRPGITALGKVTWVLGIAFVITSITLTVLASQSSKDSSVFDGIDPNNASSVSDKIDASSSSEIDTSSPLTPPRADK